MRIMDYAINIHVMPILTVVQLHASSIHPYNYGVAFMVLISCDIMLHYTDDGCMQLALGRFLLMSGLRVQELGGVCKHREIWGACSLEN